MSKKPSPSENSGLKKKSLFDHVKHIRQIQDPNYYINLSADEKKTFNHFMIVRALSMDEQIVEDMASLYQYIDKIPSPQFYQLLIALVPRSNGFYPWVKSKSLKHKKELLKYIAKRFYVSTYQANDYVNILLRTEEGQAELVTICKTFGLDDKQVEELFDDKKEI